MSSANEVSVVYIAETDYGVTPGSGNFQAARFVSESLSATPSTTESKQLRTDRMSSGQIVTGLEVGGDINFELAKETALEDFIQSAMFSAWATLSLQTVDMDIDADAKTITRSTGSFLSDGLVVGDFIKLGGYVSAKNNVVVMVASIIALVVTYVGPVGMETESGTGSTTYKRADKIGIGTTPHSFSFQKQFLDLTEKAIAYKGMMASNMKLNVTYGDLIGGSFTFAGNFQEDFDDEDNFITDGRTVTALATTNTLNGSIDMPFLASSSTGVFEQGDLCLQNVGITLENNFSPLTCIGKAAPENYSPGTASISVSLSTYLKDSAWTLLKNKLTQDPFAIGFAVQNSGGGYGFYMPSVQVSFPDPASGGQNEQVSLDMQGTAKVGATGQSALTIYRF